MVSRLTPVFRRHKLKLLSLSELWCLELGTHTGAGGSWETRFMSWSHSPFLRPIFLSTLNNYPSINKCENCPQNKACSIFLLHSYSLNSVLYDLYVYCGIFNIFPLNNLIWTQLFVCLSNQSCVTSPTTKMIHLNFSSIIDASGKRFCFIIYITD